MLGLGAPQALCGARDHEDGFMLRLALGGAVNAGTKIDVVSEELKMSGTGVDFEMAIGGIVTPNLAIHGTVLAWVVSDPEIEFQDQSENAGGALSLAGVGAGMTYFIMPVNIYLTGSAGIGQVSVSDDNISYEFGTGFMIEAVVGKEFFVSDGWGLGFSVGIVYHSVPWDGVDIDENWNGISFPIRFSATMN
jgi:hypothetical protein